MYNYKVVEKIEDMVVGKVYSDMPPDNHHASFFRLLGIEDDRFNFEYIMGAHEELYLESSGNTFSMQIRKTPPKGWFEIENYMDIDFEEIEYSFVVTIPELLTGEQASALDNATEDPNVGIRNMNELVSVDYNGEHSIIFTFKWFIDGPFNDIKTYRAPSVSAAKKVLDNLNIKYQ